MCDWKENGEKMYYQIDGAQTRAKYYLLKIREISQSKAEVYIE